MENNKEEIKEELDIKIVESIMTKADVIYEYSNNLSKEEFRDIIFKEWEKVRNDAGYFFANYFKVKWNEVNTYGGSFGGPAHSESIKKLK